jgi:hypothetical protein
MSSKRNRQTFDKMRREQTVRKRREDKLQHKADARAAKVAEALEHASAESVEETADIREQPEPATVEVTKNGSGPREAPSLRVHQQ